MKHRFTELFHLYNLFQMSNDYRMSILTSSAISCVVLRGSALVIALNWSLSTFNSQPIHSSSLRLLSPLQNFLNHHCTVHSLAVPGPNVQVWPPTPVFLPGKSHGQSTLAGYKSMGYKESDTTERVFKYSIKNTNSARMFSEFPVETETTVGPG